MRAFGKRSASAVDGFHFLRAGENAAFELEIVEAVARVRGFGEPHDGIGRQRLFVAQAQPVVVAHPASAR